MTVRRLSLLADYPNLTCISLTFVTSALSLKPDSTLVPTIITLSVLLTYSSFLFRPGVHRSFNVFLTGMALTIGSAASRIHASLTALSSPVQSIVALCAVSASLSVLVLLTLFIGTRLSTRMTSWPQITMFPALWASLWTVTSHLSPVGHLSTWSIVNNADVYNWLVPYFGSASKDWIVGSWAVVISQTITSWYMGPKESDDEIEEADILTQSSLDYSYNFNQILSFTVFLVALSTPSFFLSPLPLPVADISTTTPVTVACVIPPFNKSDPHTAVLPDYIRESEKVRSMADIVLWPEGAVSFSNEGEKNAAFAQVRDRLYGPYIGVSFEETVLDPQHPRKLFTRTGFALLHHLQKEPHMVYYKRNLVPVAESYRLREGFEPPTIFEAEIKKPSRRIPNSDWSGTKNHTRLLPITASICLDFATPAPFKDLPSRPDLILAPARTWDRSVGHAMWYQAKQRADELGSTVLWCDGGDGGVSGIAGGVWNDATQVGPGTFVRTIGVPYPANTQQTMFAHFENLGLLLCWILALGSGRPLQAAAFTLYHGCRHVLGRTRGQRHQIPEANLLNFEDV